MKLKRSAVFAVCSSLVALTAIVAALSVIGSPDEVRKLKLDEQRVGDLWWISNSMERYRCLHDSLPAALDQLLQPNEPTYGIHIKDPESNELYEYTRHGSDAYELCAKFHTTLDATVDSSSFSAFWFHGPGKKCFQMKVHSPGKSRE
jgi:hypothetical protein